MGLQKQFEEFNKTIKMDFDVKAELAEKRDILIKKLRANKDIPSFKEFSQGSYAMYTGVEPLDKEYDIDVGLRFSINKDEYQPMDLKQLIHDTLEDHTDYGAEIKKPCVTVKYKKQGELAYHVDLVAYAYKDKDDEKSQLYLAKGKDEAEQNWENADPIGLIDLIIGKYSDDGQKEQYRRVIRYMKRWKNIKFKSNGNDEPPSIGITLLAYNKFEPKKYDYIEKKYIFDDLEALIHLVDKIKSSFSFNSLNNNGEWLYRIILNLPVQPGTDVFKKMTDIQMTNFKKKIEALYDDLIEVKNEPDLIEQCKKLQKIFGDDFKIPNKEDVSKTQKNAIPSKSEAG